MNFVVPTDRKFLCQHRNGEDFLTLPATDFVIYPQGDTIEKLKLIGTYEVSTITLATSLAQISATTVGSQIKMSHPFADWGADEGFVVGNSIRIEVGTGAGALNTTETVENIVGQDMYISDTGFIAALALVDGDLRDDFVLKVLTKPTSLIMKFGIIPDSVEVANKYGSLLDGQEQVYSANGIVTTPSITDLDYLATASSNLGSVKCQFISTAELYKHTFTVEHIFRIPHGLSQWTVDYISGNVPTLFGGSNTYKYINQLNFGVNINNVNDGKIFNDDLLFSSFGFRGQNFNAGASVYSLEEAVVYNIGGSEAVNPEVTAINFVTAKIKKNNGNFTAGVKGFLYHSRQTDEADYSNNSNTWESNFIFEQIFNVDGGGAKSNLGGIISNMTVTINVGDNSILDVAYRLTYPTASQNIIDAGDLLLQQLVIEDGALSATLSDRTPIQLNPGLSSWTKDGDVPGLITNNQLDFIEVGSITSKTSVNNWINQGYTMPYNFDLKKSPNSDDSLLKGLRLQIVARNTSTNDFFENQGYDFPLTESPLVNIDGTGYQAFNIATQRFLSVPSGNSLRDVTVVSVVPGAFAATQNFSGQMGFFFNWQEWIENAQVNNAFYDGALPDEFFNKNRRLSNYSGEEGYDVFVFLVATVESVGRLTDYAMMSDKCVIGNFDDDVTGAGWVPTNTILDQNGDLTDTLFDHTMTIVRTLDMPTAGALTESELMATIVIEEENNQGRHFRLHSSIDYSEPNNPLEPQTGETGVKIVQDIPGNKIIVTCALDGTKLDLDLNHNIYVHLNNNT